MINLDAAERIIEADSFLMRRYMETDKRLAISKRIEQVFVLHVKYNPKMLALYLETKDKLQGEQS